MICIVRLALASSVLLASPVEPGTQPADPVAVKEPAPPESLPPGSVVYHTLTGRDAQVIFTSDAPLEKIIGKSNAVVGFAVAGLGEQPAKLLCATWILPVKSLATGIPLRDDHMLGKDWLDADAHPNIEFVLSRVDDIKEIKRDEGFTTWSATLVGTMSLHGISRELRVADARLSFFRESARTLAIAPGNLMFLKCEYTINLSDFGIRHSDVPKKVSDVVTLSQMLRLSSASPEAISEAAKNAAAAKKPN